MRPKRCCRRPQPAGFTLLELIVVVVLLGVLGGGAGLLITTPIEAYSDQLRRLQLVDQGEMALRQVARDVRRALPNSVRVTTVGSGWALEMVNTIDGARYRDEHDVAATVPGADDILDFSVDDSRFNFLGKLNRLPLGALARNQRIVIYNTAPGNIYGDASANNNPGVITPQALLPLPQSTFITLSNSLSIDYPNEHQIEIIPAFQFVQQSPGQRAFVVDGPISYVCNPATRRITRYSNYAYQLAQLTTDGALGGLSGVQSGPVVTQLSACTIEYEAGSSQRGGILTMGITLDNTTGENITLLHQVHVVNVP